MKRDSYTYSKYTVVRASLHDMWEKIYNIYDPTQEDFSQNSRINALHESIINVFQNNFCFIRIDITLRNAEWLLKKKKHLLTIKDFNIIKESHQSICTHKDKLNALKEQHKLDIQNLIKLLERENGLDSKSITQLFSYEDNIWNIIKEYEYFTYSEENIAEIVLKLWNESLTEVETYTYGKPFRFLVYAAHNSANRTCEMLSSSPILCASLISNYHTDTYNERSFGLIFRPHISNILFIGKGDNYTTEIEATEFHLESDYIFVKNQLFEIQRTDSEACKTYSIEQLENDIQEEKYNEINLINNEYSKPVGVFLFDNASISCIEQAEILARRLDLKIVELRRFPDSKLKKVFSKFFA